MGLSKSSKYKRDDEDGEDDDETDESDEEEDEAGALVTAEIDAQIMKTIGLIRSKNPSVYDPERKFFAGMCRVVQQQRSILACNPRHAEKV
jgi:hypothetical protein